MTSDKKKKDKSQTKKQAQHPKAKEASRSQQSHFIELMPRTFEMLQELKESFKEITESTDITDDDVINVLIQGFIESTHAHEHGTASGDQPAKGSCGEGCGCHG